VRARAASGGRGSRGYDAVVDGLESLIDRLPSGSVSTHHGELGTHARDRWALAMLRDVRGDRVAPPGALVFPRTTEEVVEVLAWAAETGTAVVTRGAGTGLCGGAQAVKLALVLDMTRMNGLLGIDPVSQTAAAQAGARAADVESALDEHGLTLGQYSESLHLATVGGMVASASSGAASSAFGTVRDLVLGLTVVLSGGKVLRLKPVPGTGAGPDLRRFFAGSEGALGVITEVTLAAARGPGPLGWEVIGPRSFDAALALMREVAQRPFRILVSRLLDGPEAEATYAPWGHDHGPILMLGLDGAAAGTQTQRVALRRLAKEMGGRRLDEALATHWWEHRLGGMEWYDGVMGPERALGRGVVADFFDLAALWRRIPRVYEEVRSALFRYAESVGCRVSNPSPWGASLLFSFVLRGNGDRDVEAVYAQAWREAAEAAVGAGATISSTHGVGALKAPFMGLEMGPDGTEVLRTIKGALDPAAIMNPGKLLPEEPSTSPSG
jgi:alkyldihydroxyacetonephosphate synthase